MGFIANIEKAGKIAEAIDKMLNLLGKLVPAKAVVLEVRNLTDTPLRLVSHDHGEGGFAEPPSPVINPGEADIFGSKSDGVAQGASGSVQYESDAGFLFNVEWNNPFGPGDPDAASSVVGTNARQFKASSIAGVGDTAQMQYIVQPGTTLGPIVRKGTAQGEAVSEIASIRSGVRELLTAVRDNRGALKLIQWSVEDDGTIRRLADSGSAAGAATQIDIARGRLFVTACRSGSGKLVLMSWFADATSIARRGDSRTSDDDDRGGAVQIVKIEALSDTLFVTAVQSASDDLVLITWRLDANNELIRIADSHGQVGEVKEISLVKATADATGNHRVVTAVRAGDDSLVMISWSITPNGDAILRRSFDHEQAGGARAIRSVFMAPDRVVTSVRADDDSLVVIVWRLETNGALTRLGNSHGMAGEIKANALMVRGDGVLSAVRAGNDDLRLIQWKISPQGAVERVADSDSQTGEVGMVALPREFEDRAPIVTAVTTPAGTTSVGILKLISWSDEQP